MSTASFILKFTKNFTSGLLAGLTHSESMSFVSAEMAANWVAGINAKHKRGNLPYRVTVDTNEPKGFVQWASESKDAFYWTDGREVYRSPITNMVDVTTGYVSGRWECSVSHWNLYAKTYGRVEIAA